MGREEEKLYTGDLVKKVGGNLNEGEVGTVLAIARAHCGGKIYKVLVGEEVKNWYGEFVWKVKKNVA
tara:strand:+ start:364 stop:564 length:201 start_codon:yes stop_codon:yes gene_type:complete